MYNAENMKRPVKISSKLNMYCSTRGCSNIATVNARGDMLCQKCFNETGLKLHTPKSYLDYKKAKYGFNLQWQDLKQKAKLLRLHPTESEVIFERKLQELGIKFIFQYPFIHDTIGGISDFYLTKQHIVVEIDGGYHLEDDQKCKDAEKDFICECNLHKKVLRLTNKQAMFLSIEQIGILIESKDKQAFKKHKKIRRRRF